MTVKTAKPIIVTLHDGRLYVRVEREIGEVSYYGPFPTRERADMALMRQLALEEQRQ